MLGVLSLLVILVLVAGARAYAIRPQRRHPKNTGALPRRSSCTLAVFLGSGGHTTEALQLVGALDFSRYTYRKYIISSGDTLSYKKAVDLETKKEDKPGQNAYEVLSLPRARRVHQSLLSTPPTFLCSLLMALWHITIQPALKGQVFADVVLLNGPGTCVVVAVCVWISRFLGFPSPRLIYVESFARVKRLSLSGKILKHFVDRFVVQWEGLLPASGPKAEYRGWLV